MDTFIIIAALALFIISSLGDSKKKQPSQKRLPPIKNPAPVPQRASKQKKTYDYMLNKTTTKSTKNVPDSIEEEKTTAAPAPISTAENTSAKMPMAAASSSTLFNSSIQAPSAADSFTETPAVKPQLAIDIHRQAVLQAITYAEVLSPPKSLKYLTRFGIKRFPMK